MRASAVVLALAATVAVGGNDAFAQASVTKAPPKTWPIGGLVSLSTSAGAGTFVSGEGNRTSISSSLNLLINYRPAPGLTLMLSGNLNKTLKDFAGDSFAPRLRNSNFDDLLLIASWSPMVKDDSPKKEMSEEKKKALAAAAAVNPTLVTASGAGKPLMLPGDIRVSFLGIIGFPTSKAAQFQTRRLNLIGAANFTKSWSRLSLTYQPRFQKNIHEYTNPIVTYEPTSPTAISREGGAEAVGENQVADGTQNVSFAIRNALIASVAVSEALSFQVFYFLLHQYRYYDAPLDNLSSAHAKAGRGRLDLQFGSIAANYVLPGSWFASLSVSTFSQPWSADNTTLRFPFFDFRSTSDNITSLGLSFTRSF